MCCGPVSADGMEPHPRQGGGIGRRRWRRSPTPAPDAVKAADIVVMMLENGPIVEQVLFGSGAADALRPGTLVVDMSSIKPAEAQDHARRLAERGVTYVDAPVSGGTTGAEGGTLAIMAGGEAKDFARAEPVLKAMGRPVHVGPHGAGQLAKLANQIIVGVTIGAVAEALLLAQKGGADPGKVREALRGGFAESRILGTSWTTHGGSGLRHQGPVGHPLEGSGQRPRRGGAARRGRDALHSGHGRSVPWPLANAGDLDHSGLLVELERRNGIRELRSHHEPGYEKGPAQRGVVRHARTRWGSTTARS